MAAHSGSEDLQARPGIGVRIVAWALFIALGYLAATVAVYGAALVMLLQGIALPVPWIEAVQRNLYHGGLRAIWQNEPGCAAFDPDLVYRPNEGHCRFRNAEFDTTLTFAGRARAHPGPVPGGKGIAVLGDSHAMGWGVDDHQTFAARLQALAGRPVHNLAVSSYGTARELGALERSGLLDAVDTVLVQYCDNDRDENLAFAPPSREMAERSFAQVTARPAGGLRERLPFLWAGLRYALKVPFAAVKERWRGERTLDFAPHLGPLASRLRGHPALAGKRVIVFYVNAHGQRFRNFPSGEVAGLPGVQFADLGLPRELFYALDDHLRPEGHRVAAERLAVLLRKVPAR